LLFQYSLLRVTDFKFDKHVPRDIPDMTSLIFFEKRAWPGTHDRLNFERLNAICSNMVKDTDFPGRLGQFGHDPLKIFLKSGRANGNVPLYFWTLNANYSNAITDFKFDIHVPTDTPDVTP